MSSSSNRNIEQAELIWPVSGLQRDPSAAGDAVAWAQGEAGSNELGVFVKVGSNVPTQLSPSTGFEYMPKTDGDYVVAYRQSGGVVLYDLNTKERSLVSHAGGPGAIAAGYIAAQGLGVEGGLGGGISLYRMDDHRWELVSAGGDSPRIDTPSLVWQELLEDAVTIRARALTGGDIVEIATRARHPSPSRGLIAWSEREDSHPHIVVGDLRGGINFRTTPGIFPNLREGLLAYLRPNEEELDLVVTDVSRDKVLLEIPRVGFPTGSGPQVAGDFVYFESKARRPVHAIYRARINRD